MQLPSITYLFFPPIIECFYALPKTVSILKRRAIAPGEKLFMKNNCLVNNSPGDFSFVVDVAPATTSYMKTTKFQESPQTSALSQFIKSEPFPYVIY